MVSIYPESGYLKSRLLLSSGVTDDTDDDVSFISFNETNYHILSASAKGCSLFSDVLPMLSNKTG